MRIAYVRAASLGRVFFAVFVCVFFYAARLCAEDDTSAPVVEVPIVRPPSLLFTVERTPENKLNNPSSIFIDDEHEEFLVTDLGTREVLIFKLDGTFIFGFGKASGVSAPVSVLTRDGKIYVVEEGATDIKVFNYRGEFLKTIAPNGVVFEPGMIKLGFDKNIYVTNKADKTCLVIDKKDSFIRTIGKGAEIRSLSGIAVGKERVFFFTPIGGFAVRVFDLQGNVIGAFEAKEGAGGTLGIPVSGIEDKDGKLWVLDTLRGVVVYGTDYRQEYRFGFYSGGRGELYFPTDIDFYGEDVIYIVERQKRRISVFKLVPQD